MSAGAAGALFAASAHSWSPLVIWRISLYVLLGLVVLVVVFGGLWTVLMLIISLCERQYLAGDVEPVSEPYPCTPSPYWRATRSDALQLGLRPAGDFITKKKTSVVKGLECLFVSQNGFVLVMIVSASFSGAKLRKTVLRSWMETGQILESSDNPGVEDLSGVVDRRVLINAGIAELMNFHIGRVRDSGLTPRVFEVGSARAEFEKMELQRGLRLVLLGLARWADPRETSIRLTWRGALANVKRILRQGSQLEDQSHRIHIARAGSRPGD